TSLFLNPLPPEAMTVLLRTPVPGLPDELQSRILERAEGVPFYAVETVRMLLDRELIVRKGASYRVVGSIDTLEVPDSLQALIAARLDGLAPLERQLLQDASVMGRTFTVAGLSTLTGMSPADLDPVLTSLVRKEVLSLSRDPLSPERGQYGFLQDLVKRVAFDTMSKKRRRALHLLAAEHLESGLRAEEGARADQAVDHFERAITLFEDHGATHPAARVSARLSEVMWDKGRLAESLESMDRAFNVLVTEPADESFAWLAAQLARFQFFHGDLSLAMDRIETALEIAESQGLPEVLSQALNTKNLLLLTRGRYQEARALLETALRIAIENDKPSATLRAHNNLIDMSTTEDRYEEAQSHADSGLTLARRVGNRHWERTFLGYC